MNEGTKEYRWIGVLAAAILLLCVTGIVQAQTNSRVTNCNAATPPNALCLEWTAPTTNVDGTPTVLPLTYRVQQKNGTAGTFTTIGTGLTVLKLYVENLSPGEYFFRVFATCVGTGCVESAASNTASKSATAPTVQPNAPILIIAATIRAGQAPMYRIVYTVRPRDGELVFVAPESMRSAFR